MAKSNSTRRNTAFDLAKPQFLAPQTRLEANRWLNMATFGAATAPIDITTSTKSTPVSMVGWIDDAVTLMSGGYSLFLDNQFADTSIPNMYNVRNTIGNQIFNGASADFNSYFFTQVQHGTAQTRLKLAYALSQLFVINANVEISSIKNGSYFFWDNLVKATQSNNTSTYRQLLTDVTMSYSMAEQLTYNRNPKANVAINTRPDENYAREILQLFSIGLYQLNMDGTNILDANGVAIPTYTPVDIPEMAKVFTGIGSYTSTGFTVPIYKTNEYLRQDCTAHENLSKTLFAYYGQAPVVFPEQLASAVQPEEIPNQNGYAITSTGANTFTIPLSGGSSIYTYSNRPFSYKLSSNVNSARIDGTASVTTGNSFVTVTKTAHGLTNGTIIHAKGNVRETVDFTLDYIFNHPNVPPFISKALIKFFTTSNPTPDYVKRVALKFVDNGNGVRGDLSAVVRAILLDREAIIPYAVNPNNFGKHLTVTDRLMRVSRAFRNDMCHINKSRIPPEYSMFTNPRDIDDYKYCAWYFTNSVMPFQSPSVFNFYRPGYVPPGSKIGSLGLTAPELQLATTDAQITWANYVSSIVETHQPTSVPTTTLLDPRGDANIFGVDLIPPSGGYTVTAIGATNVTLTGTTTEGFTSSQTVRAYAKRRSDGRLFTSGADGIANISKGSGSGLVTITVPLASWVGGTGVAIAVNDVIDFSTMSVVGYGGLPNRHAILGGGATGKTTHHGTIIMFHKVANLTPNTAVTPTTDDLNPAIDYIESVIMHKQISAEVRALMVQAGQIPVTEVLGTNSTGGTDVTNKWQNYIATYQQQRARRMVGILLVSPEFLNQG